MGTRMTELLTTWKLPTVAAELVPRLARAGFDDALAVIAEVFDMEVHARGERRVDRLRKASKLPPGKSFDSLDRTRVPRPALVRVQDLARGDFLERGGNVLLFGLPGVGKSHLA